VQQAILEIVQLHMFSELVWVTVAQQSTGLAEGNSQGRIADLFPEQIRGQDGLLGSGLVATLLTVVSLASSLPISIHNNSIAVPDLPCISYLAPRENSGAQTICHESDYYVIIGETVLRRVSVPSIP
jgi:hypothetical protein